MNSERVFYAKHRFAPASARVGQRGTAAPARAIRVAGRYPEYELRRDALRVPRMARLVQRSDLSSQ